MMSRAGRCLRGFRHKHIPLSGVLKDKSYATVTKTRILAGMTHTWRQQVVRVDREPEAEPNAICSASWCWPRGSMLRASDALLISDYGYGAATPAILNAIREKGGTSGVPVVLDSRHRMLQYSGVTAATPNEPEVEEALGCRLARIGRGCVQAGEQVMSRMKLKSLLITRGHDGMVAFSGRHKPVDIPIFGSDQVVDVTGAGDTVIATFTAALAAGASTEEAAHLANYAGGIVVMKRGTATVSRARNCWHALEQRSAGQRDPIEQPRTQDSRSRAIAAACGRMAARGRTSHAGQWMFRSAARRPRALSACGQGIGWAFDGGRQFRRVGARAERRRPSAHARRGACGDTGGAGGRGRGRDFFRARCPRP